MKRLLLLLLFSSNAQAAEWYQYAQSLDGTRYELETTLVTKHDNAGRVLVVWNKEITQKSTTVYKSELHCASKSFRVMVYDRQSPNNEYYKEDRNPSWKYAFPDSPEITLIDLSCRTWQ